jgi:hypothetical protein
MANQNGEVERSVSALAAELIKLCALEGEARDLLSVTIENAIMRLVLAIQLQQSTAVVSPESPADLCPAPLTPTAVAG